MLRNHPRSFGSGYDPLGGGKFRNVSVYPAPTSIQFGDHESDLVRRVLDDEPMHLATMAYQDVNVNIMSTATIDSAAFDKPIIHIGFDIPENTPAATSVKRFFRRSGYKIIEDTGATMKANSLDELVELINYFLDNPHQRSRERALLMEQDIGIWGPQSNDEVLARFLGLAVQPAMQPG